MIFSPPLQILELGASHVTLGVFEKTKNSRPRVTGYARANFDPCIDDDRAWLDRTAEALQRIRQRHRGARGVTLVLPGHSTLLKHVTTPRFDREKRDQVVRLEAEQCLPVSLERLSWSHTMIAERGDNFDSLICAARLETVAALCAAAETAGFEPLAAIPSSLAVLASYRQLRSAVSPAAVIEIGARSTLFLFCSESDCFVRAAVIGGRDVTFQIGAGGRSHLDEMEKLKCSVVPDARRELATDWFATRIAHEFQRTLAHLAGNGHACAAPRQIYLSGGGARLARFGSLLAKQVNLPVELLPAATNESGALPDEDAGLNTPLFGAAWLRAGANQTCVDLLPASWRVKRIAQRRWTLAASAALATAAAFAPVVLLQHNRTATQSTHLAELRGEIRPLRELRANLQEQQRALANLTTQLATVRAAVARKNAWPLLLADLERHFAGFDATWIAELRVAPAVADGKTGNEPRKLACLARTLCTDTTSEAAYRRVAAIIAEVGKSPFVTQIENQRFHAARGGHIDFEFTLSLSPDFR